MIPQIGFRDEELSIPKKLFEESKADISIASDFQGKCTGMLGMRVESDLSIEQAQDEEYDLAVAVGGSGSPDYLWDNIFAHNIFRSVNDREGVLAAICLSSVVLARAGLLNGKRATVYPTERSLSELEAAGAIICEDDVVSDGRIITAKGPQAAESFAKAILDAI